MAEADVAVVGREDDDRQRTTRSSLVWAVVEAGSAGPALGVVEVVEDM